MITSQPGIGMGAGMRTIPNGMGEPASRSFYTCSAG